MYDSNCLLLSCLPLSACIFNTSDTVFLGLAVRDETKTTTNHSTSKTVGFSNGTGSPKYSSNVSIASPLVATNESTTTIDPNRNETSSTALPKEVPVVELSNATAPKGSTQNVSIIGEAEGDGGKHDPPQTILSSSTKKSVETSSAHQETTSSVPPNFTTLLTNATKKNTLDVDKTKGSKPRKGVVFEKVDGNEKLTKELSNALSDTEVDNNPSKSVPAGRKEEEEEEHAEVHPNTASELSINVTSTTTASIKDETANSSTVLIDQITGSPATSTTTQVSLSSSPSPSTPPSPAGNNSTEVPSTTTQVNSSPSRASSLPPPLSTGASGAAISSVGVDGTSDEEDLHATAKFHLVIALVLGLMLLLTVVGLVLRRIYDVWQRRHYQRMDFLIDGLYNSVNT